MRSFNKDDPKDYDSEEIVNFRNYLLSFPEHDYDTSRASRVDIINCLGICVNCGADLVRDGIVETCCCTRDD